MQTVYDHIKSKEASTETKRGIRIHNAVSLARVETRCYRAYYVWVELGTGSLRWFRVYKNVHVYCICIYFHLKKRRRACVMKTLQYVHRTEHKFDYSVCTATFPLELASNSWKSLTAIMVWLSEYTKKEAYNLDLTRFKYAILHSSPSWNMGGYIILFPFAN
jgi:hypothetical protein